MDIYNQPAGRFTGLTAKKNIKKLGDHPIAEVEPYSFKITVEQKVLAPNEKFPTVIVEINFRLRQIKLIKKLSTDKEEKDQEDELNKKIEDEKIGRLNFKENSYSTKDKDYEVETKKIPKLILRTKSGNSVKYPLVLTPTIESNDTTIRVKFSFFLSGKLEEEFNQYGTGLKIRIAQKISGESIIAGINADSFTVKVRPLEGTDEEVDATIKFELRHATINNVKQFNPEWDELLKHESIAYLFLKPDDEGKIFEILHNLKANEIESAIKANFSFNITDGQVKGSAEKKPNTGGPNFN